MLEAIEIETGPNPHTAIVVLHGLGADGNDFVPIARELQLGPIGPVRFVFPHAATRPVTINGGMAMRAWYDILGSQINRREDEAGLRASMLEVAALIERERSRGIASKRIVLAGFSQGCAMTFLTGLRHPEPLGGLVALSGYMPLADKALAERHPANLKTPIFQAHGRQDGVLPLAWAEAARDQLRHAGHEVEWHAYDMPHSVCAEEIVDLNRWLLKVLAAPAG